MSHSVRLAVPRDSSAFAHSETSRTVTHIAPFFSSFEHFYFLFFFFLIFKELSASFRLALHSGVVHPLSKHPLTGLIPSWTSLRSNTK